MRSETLQPRWRRKFVHTTDSRHGLAVAANVLDRQFHPVAPNRVWVSDITYIRTRSGWLYLAAVLDLYSRRIVGWAMAPSMPTQLVCQALHMAIVSRRPLPGLLMPCCSLSILPLPVATTLGIGFDVARREQVFFERGELPRMHRFARVDVKPHRCWGRAIHKCRGLQLDFEQRARFALQWLRFANGCKAALVQQALDVHDLGVHLRQLAGTYQRPALLWIVELGEAGFHRVGLH